MNQLTLLSSILGPDFSLALQRQRALGLKFLDLKDGLFGESVDCLSLDNARRAAALCAEFDFQVHCLSSTVGYSNLEDGEEDFVVRHTATLDHVLRVAEILQPQTVRLLAARTVSQSGDAMLRVEREFPWVFPAYRNFISRIRAAGFAAGIENEVHGCIIATPGDALHFFELIGDGAHLIYDVQNLWQMGIFPTLEIYHQMRPIIGALHLKGGRGDETGALKWAAPLDEASWPVLDIVRAVVADGVAPFICLNPSHGEKPFGYDAWEVAQHEVVWLRHEIEGIA